MSAYEKLVSSLSPSDILSKWPEVTPLKKISGIPRSADSESSNNSSQSELFDGHDEEQIRLMEELCIVLDYDDKPVGAGTKNYVILWIISMMDYYIVHFLCFYLMKMGNYYYNKELMKNHFPIHVD